MITMNSESTKDTTKASQDTPQSYGEKILEEQGSQFTISSMHKLYSENESSTEHVKFSLAGTIVLVLFLLFVAALAVISVIYPAPAA